MYELFDQLEKLKQHEVYRSLANQEGVANWLNNSDMPRDKFTYCRIVVFGANNWGCLLQFYNLH